MDIDNSVEKTWGGAGAGFKRVRDGGGGEWETLNRKYKFRKIIK